MTDLHKITEPFGLLPEATQKALRAHHEAGGKVELYRIRGWSVCDDPEWSNTTTYRAAYEPVRTRVRKVMWMLDGEDQGAIVNVFWDEDDLPHFGRKVVVTYDEIDGKIDLSTYRVEEAGE